MTSKRRIHSSRRVYGPRSDSLVAAGGPKGFLRVPDGKTIGFADFTGNRQYLSVGNIAGNDRVSLLLMDYPNRTRLKILGHAREIGLQDSALEQLIVPGYRRAR